MEKTRLFDREDTNLHSTWTLEESGIVSLIIPELGELRMTLAKAEEIALQINRNAEFGRRAAWERQKTAPVERSKRVMRPEPKPKDETKQWAIDDRCQVNSFGEWVDGVIVGFAHNGATAMVVRDGYSQPRAFPVWNLREPI